MDKPEALRLAAIPIFERSITWQSQATIELRRLHAENEALRRERAANLDTINVDNGIITRLSSQRDALLEACKAYDQWADKTLCYDRVLRPIRAQIRAAIKAVEEGK